jgi:glycosyltransferase involved in cell wall biosynthesis
MKIIYLTSEDMRKEGGGQTHFMEVAQNLVKLGHELLVILPGYRPLKVKKDGLNICYVPTFRKNIFSYLLYEFLNIFCLSYSILKFKPDVIYSRSVLFDVMPPILASIFRTPYMMEKNGIIEDEFRNRGISEFVIWILKIAERVNLRLSTAIVCVTEVTRGELHRRYRIPEDKIFVAPNGVNPDLFRPLDQKMCRKRIGLDEDTFCVGFVGSFAPWQRVDRLIEAAKIIKQKGYDHIRYILVGDGEMTNGLKRMVGEFSLTAEVSFCGRVPYEEVPVYINSTDIGVVLRSPEITGHHPLKLYEYLSCAKPVIASRMDGLTKIVEEKNCGYISEADDPLDLALTILQAYHERHLIEKMGENGRSKVIEEHTWYKTAMKITNLLERYVNR